MSDIYSHIKLPKSSEKYLPNRHWAVLNPGVVTKDDKNRYNCKIWLVDANWKEKWPDFTNYNDLDKEQETQAKAKILPLLISGDLPIELLGGISSGVIINNDRKYVGEQKSNRVTITLENALRKKIRKLKEIVSKDLFRLTPFFPYQGDLPCISYSTEISGRPINYIIPCFEIARYYYFSSDKLTKMIFRNSYKTAFSIPELTEDELGNRVVSLYFNKTYTPLTRRVLAKLALSEEMRLQADSVYKSFLANELLQTSFFSSQSIKLDTNGVYLDNDETNYFVKNIIATDEKNPFNILQWKLLRDKSSTVVLEPEEVKGGSGSRPISKFKNNPVEVAPGVDPLPGYSEDEYDIIRGNEAKSIFDEETVIDYRIPKEDQKNKYFEKPIKFLPELDGVGTGDGNDPNSTVRGGQGTFISEKPEERQSFIRNLLAALKTGNFLVTLYNFNAKSDIDLFLDIDVKTAPLNDNLTIIKIRSGQLGRNFYFFDKMFYPYNQMRCAIISLKIGKELTKTDVEEIIEFSTDALNWHNLELLDIEKESRCEIQCFNHYSKGKLISVDEASLRILRYLNKNKDIRSAIK
ncbi:MAG: hypothetical protein ABI388_08305 [Bacteroidia bacterium]